MGEVRNFDAELQPWDAGPLRFQVSGEVFETVDPPPVGSLILMSRFLSGPPEQQAAGLWNTLALWIPESEHERFAAAAGRVSDPSFFDKFMSWVMEEVTARPTQGQSSLPASSTSNGHSSTDVLPSQVVPR